MKRRELIVATGAVAASALAGCSANAQNDGSSASGGGATDGTNPANARTITVSNTGEAEGEPDLAVLQLGVETRADTAQEARADLAQRAEDLRAALLERGLDEGDITTERFYIRERIDHRRMEAEGVDPGSRKEAEEYIYYQGTHAFRVEVRAIDEVGDVIDTAVNAGANAVDRVTFTLSDERRAQLREQALQEALRNARSEAETIADEIGASIVEATVVDASDARVSPVRREVGVAAAPTESPDRGGARTAVEPGDVTVTAEVHVRYRME